MTEPSRALSDNIGIVRNGLAAIRTALALEGNALKGEPHKEWRESLIAFDAIRALSEVIIAQAEDTRAIRLMLEHPRITVEDAAQLKLMFANSSLRHHARLEPGSHADKLNPEGDEQP